jgi:hypothetical protein
MTDIACHELWTLCYENKQSRLSSPQLYTVFAIKLVDKCNKNTLSEISGYWPRRNLSEHQWRFYGTVSGGTECEHGALTIHLRCFCNIKGNR